MGQKGSRRKEKKIKEKIDWNAQFQQQTGYLPKFENKRSKKQHKKTT